MCLILEISVVAVESALCQCIASTKASTSIIVCAHVEEEEDRVTSSHISKKLVHLINSPPSQIGVQEANGNCTLQLKNSSQDLGQL